jgi:hypothetical protein
MCSGCDRFFTPWLPVAASFSKVPSSALALGGRSEMFLQKLVFHLVFLVCFSIVQKMRHKSQQH